MVRIHLPPAGSLVRTRLPLGPKIERDVAGSSIRSATESDYRVQPLPARRRPKQSPDRPIGRLPRIWRSSSAPAPVRRSGWRSRPAAGRSDPRHLAVPARPQCAATWICRSRLRPTKQTRSPAATASSAPESRGVTPKVTIMSCSRSNGGGIAKEIPRDVSSQWSSLGLPGSDDRPRCVGMTRLMHGFPPSADSQVSPANWRQTAVQPMDV